MIEFSHVCFGYSEGADTLKNLTFKVGQGEKVCLLGLNGSGKSTLLRLAAGILLPEQGEVLINGLSTKDSGRRKELRTAVGFIFQNPDDQIVATTVKQEIAFTLENLSVENPIMKQRVMTLAGRFDLKTLLQRHPASLSGGEKQRLALAGTLVSDPQILLLDEPTSFLDHRGKRFLFELILTDQEKTVVAATQFLQETKNFQRVLFLKNGGLEFDGVPADLYRTDLIQSGSPRRESKSSSEDESSATGTANFLQDTEPRIAIKAAGLSFAYDQKAEVLENVYLEIPRLEITGIVGDSGSGKTTLGLLLSKLIAPSSGELQISAESKTVAPPAIIFQFPESQLFAETVLEEVAFGIRDQAIEENQTSLRVADALAKVGLDFDAFAARNPFTLSAGEQRRVAIASTLVMDRPILIMDEPTAGLDWLGSELILKLLFNLRQSGKTIIVMSHDFDFICRSANYIILLSDRQIRWQGSRFAPDFPSDLFHEHFGELPSSLHRARELHGQQKSLFEIESEMMSHSAS